MANAKMDITLGDEHTRNLSGSLAYLSAVSVALVLLMVVIITIA